MTSNIEQAQNLCAVCLLSFSKSGIKSCSGALGDVIFTVSSKPWMKLIACSREAMLSLVKCAHLFSLCHFFSWAQHGSLGM